jgi:hypothetical protein
VICRIPAPGGEPEGFALLVTPDVAAGFGFGQAVELVGQFFRYLNDAWDGFLRQAPRLFLAQAPHLNLTAAGASTPALVVRTSALRWKQERQMARSKHARTDTAPGIRRRQDSDPAVEAFLTFLAQDMARFPEQIMPLDMALFGRIEGLVGHLPFNPHEDLGNEPLF